MLKPPDEIYAWREEFRTNSTVLPRMDPPTRRRPNSTKRCSDTSRTGEGPSARVWPKLEGLLAEFVRIAREHKFRFIIVAMPLRQQVEAAPLFDYPQRRLAGISRALGVPLLDLPAIFRALSTEEQGDRSPDVLRPVPLHAVRK